MKRKPQLAHLKPNYLFVEVAERVALFKKNNPNKELISLSVGDTTEPIPESIANKLKIKSEALGTKEGYVGYGLEEGREDLREKIAKDFYKGKFSKEEVFISDGAICDLGRMIAFFGNGLRFAIQNPSYPGYRDAAFLLGAKEIIDLPSGLENGFFPDFKKLPNVDIIIFCNPNNPTGYSATFDQLKELVAFAKKSHALILYDAAYSHFISDQSLPKSIFEIPGSEEVAIEIHSFSKSVGFTSVRLGWTLVPKTLKYEDGHLIHSDWKRFITSIYNGTSVISQEGGLAAFSPEGIEGSKKLAAYYMENTHLLKEAFSKKGYTVYGGGSAPYLWIDCKGDSWETFEQFLQKKGIVVMPGEGFGKEGAGFIRITGFGNRQKILKAIEKIIIESTI